MRALGGGVPRPAPGGGVPRPVPGGWRMGAKPGWLMTGVRAGLGRVIAISLGPLVVIAWPVVGEVDRDEPGPASSSWPVPP